MTDAARAKLIEGDVRRHLISMTLPMIWGILAMHSLNLADTWFVSRLGTAELAAMSFTFPVVMLLLSLGIGFMAGTSSVISREIGRGGISRVQRLTTDALLLSVVCAVVLSTIGLFTMDHVFRVMGATEALLPLIREYMVIWFLGYVLLLAPMAGIGCLRATGDAKLQARILIMASLINLILDPILIFGWFGVPAMGIAGAATATVLARGSTLIIGYLALRKLDMISLEFPRYSELLNSWRALIHVGLPAAGTNMIIPLGMAMIVSMVAEYGAEAVAGHGAATRVEALVMVVFLAMSSIIGPFVGQNLGAGKPHRIHDALRLSTRFCITFGLVLSVLIMLAARSLIGLFSNDAAILEYGQLYLFVVTLGFGAAGIVMVVNAAFNGLGRPLPAVVISTSRIFLLMVPLAWLGERLVGLGGLFAGVLIANLVSAWVGYTWFQRGCSRDSPGPWT